MGSDRKDDSISSTVVVLLVVIPIIGGGLLFVFFDAGPIHRLGLFMMGAGAIVGAAILMMRSTGG